MAVSKAVRKYVELALREKIATECPNFTVSLVEEIVSVSMKGMGVTKGTLYRAIEIASQMPTDETSGSRTTVRRND